MIFIGDIASPNSECSNQLLASLKEHENVFKNNFVIANLEGLLSNDYYKTINPVLSNHPSVIEPLKFINSKVVSLANNHTLDIPQKFMFTKNLLQENQIKICGAGFSKKEAETPVRVVIDNQLFFFLGFSWAILMQHQKNNNEVFVNTIVYKNILNQIRELKKDNPQAKLILIMHWNFDLETLPFPLHREVSMAMIDAGANAVIGSHSHCVQGGEKYNDGLIFYGLGNFFFPWFKFSNGASFFPDWTKTELALEWNPNNNDVTCHWFQYNYKNGLNELLFIGSEDFETGTRIQSFSPYRGMGHQTYIKWFRENRRKKFLMPVYKSHNDIIRNKLIDYYLEKRITFARFLAKKKIIKWHK